MIDMKRQLPKNVRQIGNVSDSSKIYVEDYVDTFFNQLCDKAEQEPIGAFLIGEIVHEEEQDYIYVYGAIRMKELGKKGKEFFIEDHTWKNACETCKEYFGDAEILGWFITGDDQSLEVNHNIQKAHQKYFSREKSLFVVKSTRDKEEKFYIYKYRNMLECQGHYIYYEKNAEMQNYMIATRKRTGFTPSEIIEDRVTKNFRSLVREKAKVNEQKNSYRWVYAMSTFLILVIVVIGVTMINNYEKMEHVQNTIQNPSTEVVEKEEEKAVATVGDQVTAKQEEEDKLTEQLEQDVKEEEKKDEEKKKEEDESVEEEQPEKQQVEMSEEAYIVQKGDTLVSICVKKYGNASRINEICRLNGLEDGNLIFVGQKLLLP